ncbi:TRAP-type C4-dicarboxylate transport system, periplasmic component [Rhodovulum sp. PH10]|uniref:TRAP transporter substrate-binding protein n=1 Tax=Rhodovulum sp. PH10 TaxID=1187851 RepID=UPI00027C2C70|nr:TRAP transporter substrate-binding protein [Rhodovulum sp. PH10]EJW10592.1 TRAP-type C4-dicarboxylate transport system, periplasmic component [Rhodovulum sp. PH10]
MPDLSRRRLLATAALAVPAVLAMPHVRAKARSKFVYKYGNNLPLTHPLNVRAAEAAAKIKTETEGALDIRIFPNNQLGGDTDMLNQVRSGALDFFTPSALVIATLVPAAPINAVGFAFPSYERVWAAMDGDLGGFIGEEIEKSGLHMMRKVWDNGFRQLTTSGKPVVTPDDLAGIKIRVPVSQLSISLFQALGAAPTSMQFSEVYTALQTKIVDAQENPLPIIQTAKLFEVQKYGMLTNHIWDGYLFVASGKTWYRLPKDIQAIAEKTLNDCGMEQRDDIAKLNASVQADLEAKGMVFSKPDPAPFREALAKAGFYVQWREKFGDAAWTRLEKYVGKLG